jgi:hypothetical protein
MQQRRTPFRFLLLTASFAGASLSAVGLLGASHLSAAHQEVPPTKGPPIPASQIHEELIVEVGRGSDILSVRVTGMGTTRHVAWVERSKGSETVWLDGKQVGGVYDEVKYLAFLGDSSALALVAGRKSKWTLRVGAQEYGGDYSEITAPDLGPHNEVVAGVCREKRCRLLVDGRETGPVFDDISAPDFSPKRNHSVYFGKRSKKWVALVDGKETGPEMDGWWTHRWRSEGAALAVAGVLDGKSTWVIDGAAGPLFDVISDITFSRDGQHYAYGGAEAAAGFTKQQVLGSMVVDGKVLEPSYEGRGMLGSWTWLGGTGRVIAKGLRRLSPDFHGVSDPEFTGSGEVAFGQRLGDGQVTVRVGDRTGPMLDDLASWIVVSADGEHIAYVGRKEDVFVEVRDQTPGATFSAKRDVAVVSWIGMSEGGHLTYSTVRGGAEFKGGRSARALRQVIVDGVAGAEYDALGITPCRISKSGEQHAYVVVGAEGNRDRFVLNGRESGLYDDIVSGSINFVPPAGAEFVARRERRLVHVNIEVR